MNCPVCEKEFYGVGFLTHNDKTLCRTCTWDVINNHASKFKYSALAK